MASKGTRKVIVGGQEQYQPAELVELADIIALGVAATEDLERCKERLEAVKERFLAIVEQRREGRASVRLDGLHGGTGIATWSTEKRVDQDAIAELERRMHDDETIALFMALFESQRVYRLSRGFSKVMKSAGKAVDPYLKAIATAVEVKPKRPLVRFTAEAPVSGEMPEVDDA